MKILSFIISVFGIALPIFYLGVLKLLSNEINGKIRFPWLNDFPYAILKLNGFLDLIVASSIILYWFNLIPETIYYISLVGFSIMMALATYVHIKRKENKLLSIYLLACCILCIVITSN